MASVAHSARLGRPRGPAIAEGTPFGRLTILSGPFCKLPRGRVTDYYRCRCECGRITDVQRGNLTSSPNISCGCWRRERLTRHGDSKSRLHNVWNCILQRCHNPSNPNYSNYGGRGIYVCPEWQVSYEAFRDWALANNYRDDLEIDRFPDNDGPYYPENCRWATRQQQNQNKRNNRFYTAFGETKCITDWTRDPRCMVDAMTVRHRMKRGWSFERALSTPPTPKNRRYLRLND